MKQLLSYAIGCMLGRYSLDKPGLIYAHSGNEGFDPSQYKSFRADDDGILPLFDTDWGIRDDATSRFIEFIGVAWSKQMEENLKFVAESLDPNNGEQPRDTICRYFGTGFYKHHLSMYNKCPIYWLFSLAASSEPTSVSSIFIDTTKARFPGFAPSTSSLCSGKLTGRITQLTDDIPAASSQLRKRLEKEKATAAKQLVELQGFDEKLRHYADQRIKLDLDDGVKVNYGKFSDPEIGDILADVKAVCGTKEDD